jgi:large subunit ribosomal protein L10
MPKTRVQKKEIVAQLVEKLQKTKSLVFVDFTGLKTTEVNELRDKCSAQMSEYVVTKKTLFDVAVKEAAAAGIVLKDVSAKALQGEIALLLGYGDELAPMKLSHAFAKDHAAMKIRGGAYEGTWLDAAKVLAMAKLPGKAELLARLVGSLRSPLVGMVNVLQGNLRGILQVLHARARSVH